MLCIFSWPDFFATKYADTKGVYTKGAYAKNTCAGIADAVKHSRIHLWSILISKLELFSMDW